MPLPRLIPCLDVAAGRVVKGVRFEGLRDVGDAVELGAAYSDAGADELVFLDIKATLEERASLAQLVRQGKGSMRLPLAVRCRDCGQPGTLQVRPPMPTRGSVGWIMPPMA